MSNSEKTLTIPRLLIAMPQLDDPNFKRTVILLMEHGPSGSFGLILNRLTPVKLKEVVNVDNLEIPEGIPTWYGGPVAASYGFVLRCLTEEEQAAQGKEGFALSACDEEIKGMVNYYNSLKIDKAALNQDPDIILKNPITRRPALYPYRFIIGYTGWGPGQLVNEIKIGAWMEMPVKFDWIFNTSHHDIWDLAFDSLGIHPATMAPSIQPYLC